MTARVIHADCLDAMREMPDACVDAIVTDPPYELSNDGKASAYRVFAECVLPKHPNIDAAFSGEDCLPLLVSKILALSGGGLTPRPPASVPVRSVAFDCEPSRANNDVEYTLERSVLTADRNLCGHAESEETEHIGSFAFKAADTATLFKALDRVGAGFVSGGLGIGFRVSPASAPCLLGGGPSIDNCNHLVGPRHNALTELVRALARAEDVPVARFHLGRSADETISADGALVLCATMLLGGAQLVRAISPARGLPTVLESRRVRVVDAKADRACTFDLVLHPVTVATAGFMGKEWDGSKVAYNVDVWREALRVAKPGAHLVAFGGTRTYHRLACAIEDAGWEIRDCLSWLYGSGFPKSLDVSKALDKGSAETRDRALRFTAWMRATGITIEQINTATNSAMGSHYLTDKSQPAIATADMFDLLRPHLPEVPEEIERLVAERTGIEWTAYKQRAVVGSFKSSLGGTVAAGLRDAEYIAEHRGKVVPLTTPATDAARQWQGWGTALKPAWEPIILARKPIVGTVAANVTAYGTGAINVDACRIQTDDDLNGGAYSGARRPATSAVAMVGRGIGAYVQPSGRWPANVALDEEAAAMLGEPARFFYTAKASRSERNDGCDAIEARPQDPTRDVDAPGGNNPRNRGAAPRVNSHPTVKPVALMRWLVRMVTPPGGVVLDPFCGSGTTLVAAIEEGFDCIGVEREAEYVAIVEARVAAAQQRPQRVAKPKPKRQPVKVQPAATAPPTPIVSAPLPGQLALAWGAE